MNAIDRPSSAIQQKMETQDEHSKKLWLAEKEQRRLELNQAESKAANL